MNDMKLRLGFWLSLKLFPSRLRLWLAKKRCKHDGGRLQVLAIEEARTTLSFHSGADHYHKDKIAVMRCQGCGHELKAVFILGLLGTRI